MIKRIIQCFEKSIFYKILLSIIFLVIIPFVCTIIFTYNKLQVISQNEFENYSLEFVTQVQHNLSNYLDEMEKMTYTITSDTTVQEALSLPAKGLEIEKMENYTKVKYIISNIIYFRPENTSLIISGLNNELYYTGGYNLDYNYDFNNNPYTDILNTNNKSIYIASSHIREYTNDNKIVFSIIRMIRDNSTHMPLGYIYLDIDKKMFGELINDVVLTEGNDILILDNNKVVYSKNTDNVLDYTDSKLNELINSDQKNGQFVSIDGNKYFFTYATMDETDWKIVSLHSMESYNQKAFNITKSIVLILLICLLIAIIIAIFISAAITRPVKELSHLMKKVEKGDFDVQFSSTTKDEIGTLGEVFNLMIIRIKTLIQKVYTSKLAEKDAIIYALQSQINPHFLYNTLQSISDIAEHEYVSDITEICNYLSSIFRYNIESKDKLVRLYDEVNHIENYISLQSITHKDRLNFLIDIPPQLLNIKVLRFILQPIVENSIIHGLFPKSFNGTICISATTNNNILQIAVKDDGIGIPEELLKQIIDEFNKDISTVSNFDTKFLALNNVNKRLILNYGKEYKLIIKSCYGKGTVVLIKIPFSENVD